jgi:hypothetical protein
MPILYVSFVIAISQAFIDYIKVITLIIVCLMGAVQIPYANQVTNKMLQSLPRYQSIVRTFL